MGKQRAGLGVGPPSALAHSLVCSSLGLPIGAMAVPSLPRARPGLTHDSSSVQAGDAHAPHTPGAATPAQALNSLYLQVPPTQAGVRPEGPAGGQAELCPFPGLGQISGRQQCPVSEPSTCSQGKVPGMN